MESEHPQPKGFKVYNASFYESKLQKCLQFDP